VLREEEPSPERPSISQRHAFHLFAQLPPIVRLHLCILHALLTPVLVKAADVVLAALEEEYLVTDALLHEDGSRVLRYYGLLVLSTVSLRAMR
jgi:hypothetical protein